MYKRENLKTKDWVQNWALQQKKKIQNEKHKEPVKNPWHIVSEK